MKPNTQFELSVSDLEQIEAALHTAMCDADLDTQRKIQKLLGKLHNQKNWYRPKNQIYVGG